MISFRISLSESHSAKYCTQGELFKGNESKKKKFITKYKKNTNLVIFVKFKGNATKILLSQESTIFTIKKKKSKVQSLNSGSRDFRHTRTSHLQL